MLAICIPSIILCKLAEIGTPKVYGETGQPAIRVLSTVMVEFNEQNLLSSAWWYFKINSSRTAVNQNEGQEWLTEYLGSIYFSVYGASASSRLEWMRVSGTISCRDVSLF